MDTKDNSRKSTVYEVRNDADLQAIQTSVAFKNISDAIEQYRRQFGLAFLALIAFSAIHVGLVVIANLYTMETRVSGGVLTSTSDPQSKPVGVAMTNRKYDLTYVMTNMNEEAQLTALNNLKSTNFVDREGNYRQYTVTGFQLGGWKRSELKLYTSVGHVLEYVRGKGLRVHSGDATMSAADPKRKLLQFSAPSPPPGTPSSPSPPPPVPPGGIDTFTYNTVNSATYNMTQSLLNSSASTIEALNEIIANGTAGNVYTVSTLDTLRQMAGLITDTTVRSYDAPTVWTADAVTKAEKTAEEAIWSGMDYTAQDSLLSWAQTEALTYAESIIASLNDSSINTSLISYDGFDTVTGGLTAAQSAATKATIATKLLVAAQDEANYLQGQAYWDAFKAAEEAYNEAVAATPAPALDPCFNRTANSGCGNTALANWYNTVSAEVEEASMALALAANETARAVATYIDNNPNTVKNFTQWYDSQVAYQGSESAFHDDLADNVVLWVTNAIEFATDAFSDYKADGYINWASFANATAVAEATFTPVSTDYGCSGQTEAVLRGDSWVNPLVEVVLMCTESKTDSDIDPYFSSSFFSSTMGGWEKYSMYIPPSLCNEVDGITATTINGANGYLSQMSALSMTYEYLYMLHGWGGSDSFMMHMAHVLQWVFTSGTHYAAVDGFIVIAPADAGTPYPGKSWYLNNEFTGFHQDMIVFELQQLISTSLGTSPRVQGVFGFSMGGWGSLQIAMTYPDHFNSIGTFNGVIKPNVCLYVDTCHAQCGVDFFMCELMWTSITVATTPYVVVGAGEAMATSGDYAPMAIGNVAAIVDYNLIYGGFLTESAGVKSYTAGSDLLSCVYGSGYVAPSTMTLVSTSDMSKMGTKVTKAKGFGEINILASDAVQAVIHMYGYENTDGNFNDMGMTCTGGATSCPMYQQLTWVFEPTSWYGSTTGTFYLNPQVYAQSAGYDPTHNTITAARLEPAYTHFKKVMPFYRLRFHKDGFKQYPLQMMIACDHNDQNGAGADTDGYMNIFMMEVDAEAGNLHRSSGWIYDKFDSQGHSYSQRDIRVTIQWFSDTFRTSTGIGDMSERSAETKDCGDDCRVAMSTSDMTAELAKDGKTLMEEMFEVAEMKRKLAETFEPLVMWGPCYLQMEYATNFGATSSSQASVFSGGNFDHTGACDEWLYPDGLPAGIFADQFEQVAYAAATHALESGPSAEQFEMHNKKVADLDKTGGTTGITGATASCWLDIGDSVTYTDANENTVTAGPKAANGCCGSATECRDQVIYAYGYTRQDCCDKNDLSSMPEYSGAASAKMDFVKGMMDAAKGAFEDMYEEEVEEVEETGAK